jgi:quinol monooxygenase YgiN
MGRFTGLLVLALAMTAGTVTDAPAQAGSEARVYSVIYVEVVTTAVADGVALLKRYRDAARRQDGNVRCEVVQRIGQPYQLVVLEVWRDRTAFEAHGGEAGTTELRGKLAALRAAPADERVHGALSVGPPGAAPPRDAIYVVTHVDVIPPRKDDGVGALRRLAESSRTDDGNLLFEVAQQANRPNHFTVVEVWRDAKAAEAHAMAKSTREFRDALATMTGALYDERMYRAID